MAVLEVIRCAMSSGNHHVQSGGAHKRGCCQGTRPSGALVLVCDAAHCSPPLEAVEWLVWAVAGNGLMELDVQHMFWCMPGLGQTSVCP